MTYLKDIQPSEYSPYFKNYLDLIDPEAQLQQVLKLYRKQTLDFLETLDKDLNSRYAPGKWTVGEVIMHNIDTERVFQYRALRFLRGDQTELAGFDQDVFVGSLKGHAFAKAELITAFTTTRDSSISIFEGASDEKLRISGVASGKSMSVRTMPFLIAGHHKHHERIIEERY